MNGHSRVEQGFHKVPIKLCGGEQSLDQRLFTAAECGFSVGASLCEHLSHQAEAVAVNAAAGNPENAIASADLPTVDELLLLDYGHAETC